VTVITEARPAQNTFFSSFVMYESTTTAATAEDLTAKAGVGSPIEQAVKHAMKIGMALF
tara:strand:+ start:159 stop:335 length:177 start_codon:yes stop_codon:yes gene_type:complete